MKNSRSLLLSVLAVLFFFALVNLGMDLQAQFMARDPGPRGGKVGAGQPVSGLTANQMGFFQNGLQRFLEVDSVGGTISGEPGNGLGPTFNDNQCASCHSQPATEAQVQVGPRFPSSGPTPKLQLANLDGASNTVPFFIRRRWAGSRGPPSNISSVPLASPAARVTVACTICSPSRDGSTPPTSSAPADSCRLADWRNPIFEQMGQLNNLSYRIPTPLFGAGLIENIAESTIDANIASDSALKRAPRNRRSSQSKSQRRHHLAVRWKGAEQVASALLRRSLQRGNRRQQRIFPQRTRLCSVQTGPPTACSNQLRGRHQ